jgi:septal ring factor EnvC (AmiA/AmiB activator)
MKEGAMVDTTGNRSDQTEIESKFTAAHVEINCPTRLQEIGRETVDRLVEARKQIVATSKQVLKARQQIGEFNKQIEESEKQIKLAHDHLSAAAKLIAEAKQLCDDDGFDAFRKRFFPNSDRLIIP